MSVTFPFSAIVGQDEMKLALTLAAVEPALGGVLVLGDRGTGKSTAVRALAAVLPAMAVSAGCPYGCDPAEGAPHCDACAIACAATRSIRSVPRRACCAPSTRCCRRPRPGSCRHDGRPGAGSYAGFWVTRV